MTDIAIALFIYNRPSHTAKTLEALRDAHKSQDLPLYVFADGPKTEESRKAVKEVRDLFTGYDWLAGIERDFAVDNRGLAKSIIRGVSHVLGRHEAVVVLEDDIVLAQNAIEYFLQALQLYRERKAVASISGFAHPAQRLRIPVGYPYDAYFLTRMYSWGWATWRDRWNTVDWDIERWCNQSNDKYLKNALFHVSPDLPEMMNSQRDGTIDSWAVRFVYDHFISGAVSLIPVRSYVQNIGMDGSGVHSGTTDRERNDLALAKDYPLFPPFVSIDRVIQRRHRRLYSRRWISPRRAASLLYRRLVRNRGKTGVRQSRN